MCWIMCVNTFSKMQYDGSVLFVFRMIFLTLALYSFKCLFSALKQYNVTKHCNYIMIKRQTFLQLNNDI